MTTLTEPRAAADRRAPGVVLSNADPSLRGSWLAIARSAEVTEQPSKFWLLGEPFVAYRDGANAVVFADRCPHRRAPLSEGRLDSGVLTCPYHGWQFASDGQCVLVPSIGPDRPVPPRARLEPIQVEERHGLVFVALASPVVEIPSVPTPRGAHVALAPYEGRYGASLLIDNQLDIAHFAFVHAATFGDPDQPETPPYSVVREGLGFTAELEVPFTAANDPAAQVGEHPLVQHRRMRYRYEAPFFVELALDYPVMGGTTTIHFFATPLSGDRSRFYVDLYFDREEGFSADELAERVAFEQRVIAEDLGLQERFDTTDLPLGPQDECHVRADRASIEYRRILAELVEMTR